jgi:predicted O-methyltransferase YrrM
VRKMLTWQPTVLDGHPIDTSLTERETEALRDLAAGKRLLEIGSAFGYSAIVMAQVAKHVTAVDPHAGELPDSLEIMQANLALFDVAHVVTIVRDCSQNALPAMLAEGSRFEFVFIDGNHGEQVQGDVELSRKLLEPGGHFAVHDYYEEDFPEIARVLDALEPVKIVDTLWIGRV